MSSPVYTPSPVQVDLTDSLGAICIGVFIAMALTGLSINQTAFYYRSFPDDPMFVKATVALACSLNILHSILLPKCLYFWIITNWGSVSSLDFVDWSYNVNLAVNGLLSLVVQLFFAWRVYMLSKRQLLLPLIICVISITQASWAVACSVMAFRLVRQSSFGSFTYGVDVWQYGAAAADIIIAGTVVYHLRNAKTDFAHTNSILDQLIAVTLESNLLTAVLSIIVAILFSTIRNGWPNALNFIAARMYYISLMVNVNARHQLAKKLENSQGFHMSPVGPVEDEAGRKRKMLSGVRVVSKTTTVTDQPYPIRNISTVHDKADPVLEEDGNYEVPSFVENNKMDSSNSSIHSDGEEKSRFSL